MPQYDFLRRASYGPASPAVGERGARTRQRIVDVTLGLFAERGFHDTMVDDITTSVGISRAALYQYFESKEDIFIQLLRECGAALLRVIPLLGRTGPTAQGFDNLHWWLGEWAWVYDKYSTMFAQWSAVDSPRAPLRPLIADFDAEYTRRMTERLRGSGLAGLDLADFAAALLVTVTKVNHRRTVGSTRGVEDAALLDALAIVFQLALHPSTPGHALARAEGPVTAFDWRRPSGRRAAGAEVPPQVPGATGRAHRLAGCSPQVQATVTRLLDAGGGAFATRGYHLTTVEDVVGAAGLGRGTFYKYFADKTDLLCVLAEDCAASISEGLRHFDAAAADGLSAAALRDWLGRFVALHHSHAGVFRAWSEGEPDVEGVQLPGRAVTVQILDAFDRVLGAVARPYPFDVRAGSLVALSLIEQLPGRVVDEAAAMDDGRLVETMAVVIERGLLGRSRRRRQRYAAPGI